MLRISSRNGISTKTEGPIRELEIVRCYHDKIPCFSRVVTMTKDYTIKITFNHMFEAQLPSNSTPGYCFATLITFACNCYGRTKQYKMAYRILMRVLLYEIRYQERKSKPTKKLTNFWIWNRVFKITEKVSLETWINLAKIYQTGKKTPNCNSNDHSIQFPKAVLSFQENYVSELWLDVKVCTYMPICKIQFQCFVNSIKLPPHSKHAEESWEQGEASCSTLWSWTVLKILKHAGNLDFINIHTILHWYEQCLSSPGGSDY